MRWSGCDGEGWSMLAFFSPGAIRSSFELVKEGRIYNKTDNADNSSVTFKTT